MAADEPTLAPDDAFEVLGNETRLAILQALGEADGPVPFSGLRERVGVRDSGQFNYHLDRLVGHFVERTDDGYVLRRAGARVVEAVLSGAVTDAPVLEPTAVDQPCPFCGAPVDVTYRQERVELYCTECSGTFDGGTAVPGAGHGYLGYHPLPPAGVEGRSAAEVHRAALTWGHLELLAASSDVCPRCSATVDRETRVCDAHDAGDGLCAACGRRHAVAVDFRCSNCIYDESGPALVGLASATPLLAFLTERGYNPVSPTSETLSGVRRAISDYGEEVRETDPLRARFTVTLDDDALVLTVADDLRVTDATVG